MRNLKDLKLLTGNEAIARGAYEAGVKVAVAYPGTPSTEILENTSSYKEIYCQWSINEKVAMEVASGSSMAGSRTLVAMKHVGLNVAADPFMTLSYTGVNGGLVIVSADDPGMHSSQNEQDNRYYSKFSKIPMLEPSDSQEAKDFVKEALAISEEIDAPVILRTTTRISHSKSVVKLEERSEVKNRTYKKNCQKYVMIPAYGRQRHKILLKRWERLKRFVESSRLNWTRNPLESSSQVREGNLKSKSADKKVVASVDNIGDSRTVVDNIGIVTSGVSYQYTREVFSNVPILKLSITNPLAEKTIEEFARGKKLLVIIEELEPFLEEQIKEMNIKAEIIGKEYFPQFGELSIEIIENLYDELFGTNLFRASGINISNSFSNNSNSRGSSGIDGSGSSNGSINISGKLDKNNVELKMENKSKVNTEALNLDKIPPRPPVLCAGCPHRPVFYILKKLRAIVMGDIGCYTLSVLPPLSSLDSCLCMGAGIGQALGMEKANNKVKGRVVSVIGDSTFFHSGITPLIDSIYNKSSGLIIILDNRTTAMTGRQVNPGVGKTLMGENTTEVKPEDIARAAGVKNVKVVNPYNLKLLEKIITEELNRKELSVIISRQKCVLLDKVKSRIRVYIDVKECIECGLCLKFGCPAIEYRNNKYSINELLCTGCKVCVDICKKDAIKVENKYVR